MRKIIITLAGAVAVASAAQASIWVNGINQDHVYLEAADALLTVNLAAVSNTLDTTILNVGSISNLLDTTVLNVGSISNVADAATIDIQMLHLTNSGTFGGVPVQTRWYNDGGTNIYQVLNNSVVGFEVRF